MRSDLSTGCRVRVKICGITGVADAAAAVEAGADAIGLNFVGGPRQIEPQDAREILSRLGPLVTPVALVRLERGRVPDLLMELLGEYWVSHLQVYGEVTAEALGLMHQTGFRPMPVLAVKDEGFAARAADWLTDDAKAASAAIVLDAYDPARQGGTGTPFCWDWVSAARQAGRLSGWPPIVLAGGLKPENVADAIRIVQPFAVDVSSGVEVAESPGKKDHDKMQAFVRNAKAVAFG